MSNVDDINRKFFPRSFDTETSDRIERGIRNTYLEKLSKIKSDAEKSEKQEAYEAERRAEQARLSKLKKLMVPTERQLEALNLIDCHQKQYGFPITYAEMSLVFEFESDNASYELVNALIKKELVTRKEGKNRTVQLTEKGKELI